MSDICGNCHSYLDDDEGSHLYVSKEFKEFFRMLLDGAPSGFCKHVYVCDTCVNLLPIFELLPDQVMNMLENNQPVFHSKAKDASYSAQTLADTTPRLLIILQRCLQEDDTLPSASNNHKSIHCNTRYPN
jgi:hypothetical protein